MVCRAHVTWHEAIWTRVFSKDRGSWWYLQHDGRTLGSWNMKQNVKNIVFAPLRVEHCRSQKLQQIFKSSKRWLYYASKSSAEQQTRARKSKNGGATSVAKYGIQFDKTYFLFCFCSSFLCLSYILYQTKALTEAFSCKLPRSMVFSNFVLVKSMFFTIGSVSREKTLLRSSAPCYLCIFQVLILLWSSQVEFY